MMLSGILWNKRQWCLWMFAVKRGSLLPSLPGRQADILWMMVTSPCLAAVAAVLAVEVSLAAAMVSPAAGGSLGAPCSHSSVMWSLGTDCVVPSLW